MGDEASKQKRMPDPPQKAVRDARTAAAAAKAAQGDKPAASTAAPATSSKLSDPATGGGLSGGPSQLRQTQNQPPPQLGNEYKKPSPTKKCMAYKSLETDIEHKMRTLCNDSTNQSLCDSTWEIGKKKVQFHVVSALFAIHSTDLDDILKEHKSKTIVYEDITPDCFRFMREYFYSLNPVISLQNIAHIFYVAEKFKISHLIVAAKQFIDGCAGINDLVLVLSQLHARKLYQECNRIISTRKLFEGQQSIKVLQCENLKTLPCALMIRLLQYDSIKMAEETIFERSTDWAQWKEKVAVAKKSEQKSISLVTTEEAKIEGWDDEDETDWKQIIQPLLQYIRFPIMNGEYFTSNVVDMKILSTDDCTLIMQFLFTQKENDALKYSTKKRYILPPKGTASRG